MDQLSEDTSDQPPKSQLLPCLHWLIIIPTRTKKWTQKIPRTGLEQTPRTRITEKKGGVASHLNTLSIGLTDCKNQINRRRWEAWWVTWTGRLQWKRWTASGWFVAVQGPPVLRLSLVVAPSKSRWSASASWPNRCRIWLARGQTVAADPELVWRGARWRHSSLVQHS